MKTVNIGLIGHKFMGKMHSSAWSKAALFFDTPFKPILKVVCGIPEDSVRAFAKKWGWEVYTANWREVIERDDIDIIDVCTPTYLHYEMVMAAVKAGKHIFCEKPIALSLVQAKEMHAAAESAGVVHYLNHNYRRNPAVMLARRLIEEHQIGKVFHWRSAYLQSWITDPAFPLTWHLRKEMAGMGPMIDLNSHSVDLARFLVGEIRSVMAINAQFIKERPLPDEAASSTFFGVSKGSQKGPVTVEDAAFMLVEFENGALGSVETSRFATGRKNFNTFEIYGDCGSVAFNQERMNELQFYSSNDPPHAQGFRTILATEPEHAYMKNWWPPGHIIGYEHAFIHAVVDFLDAIDKHRPVSPNFMDGVRNMEVLEAGMRSAQTGQKVNVGT